MTSVSIDCPECLRVNTCRINIKSGKCLNYEVDNVKYYQHKYFRSCLLPSIALAMGEVSNQYVHDFILKPKWLIETSGFPFYEYEKYTDIPDKHIDRANVWQIDNGHFASIPSMARFTIKEAKSYIEFCEKILYVEIGGGMSKELQEEAAYLKGKLASCYSRGRAAC